MTYNLNLNFDTTLDLYSPGKFLDQTFLFIFILLSSIPSEQHSFLNHYLPFTYKPE